MDGINKSECGLCRYRTVKAKKLDEIICRRYPPVNIVMGMTKDGPMVVSMYPTVRRDWACGEFASEILNG